MRLPPPVLYCHAICVGVGGSGAFQGGCGFCFCPLWLLGCAVSCHLGGLLFSWEGFVSWCRGGPLVVSLVWIDSCRLFWVFFTFCVLVSPGRVLGILVAFGHCPLTVSWSWCWSSPVSWGMVLGCVLGAPCWGCSGSSWGCSGSS